SPHGLVATVEAPEPGLDCRCPMTTGWLQLEGAASDRTAARDTKAAASRPTGKIFTLDPACEGDAALRRPAESGQKRMINSASPEQLLPMAHKDCLASSAASVPDAYLWS